VCFLCVPREIYISTTKILRRTPETISYYVYEPVIIHVIRVAAHAYAAAAAFGEQMYANSLRAESSRGGAFFIYLFNAYNILDENVANNNIVIIVFDGGYRGPLFEASESLAWTPHDP